MAGIALYTVSSLRQLIKEYITELANTTQHRPANNWVYQAMLAAAQQDETLATTRWQQYLAQVHLSARENAQDTAIVGDPLIDGRILCQQLNLRLHILIIQQLEKPMAFQHLLIDKQGSSQTIDASNQQYLYHDPAVIHLAKLNDRFVPMLPSHAFLLDTASQAKLTSTSLALLEKALKAWQQLYQQRPEATIKQSHIKPLKEVLQSQRNAQVNLLLTGNQPQQRQLEPPQQEMAVLQQEINRLAENQTNYQQQLTELHEQLNRLRDELKDKEDMIDGLMSKLHGLESTRLIESIDVLLEHLVKAKLTNAAMDEEQWENFCEGLGNAEPKQLQGLVLLPLMDELSQQQFINKGAICTLFELIALAEQYCQSPPIQFAKLTGERLVKGLRWLKQMLGDTAQLPQQLNSDIVTYALTSLGKEWRMDSKVADIFRFYLIAVKNKICNAYWKKTLLDNEMIQTLDHIFVAVFDKKAAKQKLNHYQGAEIIKNWHQNNLPRDINLTLLREFCLRVAGKISL